MSFFKSLLKGTISIIEAGQDVLDSDKSYANICPDCGTELTFDEEYEEYHCPNCDYNENWDLYLNCDCGTKMVYLGRGLFVCPECGNERLVGEE